MAKGGKYFSPEKAEILAKLLEAGDVAGAQAMMKSSGRGAWKAVKADPAKFLTDKAAGTLRVVIRGPKGTVCLERPTEDYKDKSRKYIYQDLAEVL